MTALPRRPGPPRRRPGGRPFSSPLRRSRKDARFRDLVEGAGDVILRIDAQGGIEYANPAAGELVGQEPAALVGRPFLDLVRADYRDQARRFYEDQRQQRIPTTYCEFPLSSPAATTSGWDSARSS